MITEERRRELIAKDIQERLEYVSERAERCPERMRGIYTDPAYLFGQVILAHVRYASTEYPPVPKGVRCRDVWMWIKGPVNIRIPDPVMSDYLHK